MRLVGPGGTLHSPIDAICYEDGGGCFHLLEDRGELELKPGDYELQGMRGFRRALYSEKIQIREGKLSQVWPEVQELDAWQGSIWREGDLIVDTHRVVWLQPAYAGKATIEVGLYDFQTQERVPAFNAMGNRLPHDRVTLGEIVVRAP